jgi:phosphatidylinositol-3-phosphatase
MALKAVAILLGCVFLLITSAFADNTKGSSSLALRIIPRPDHVVIVIEENKSYKLVIGNPAAKYINALAKKGALFTNSFAIGHPSQPNYLALFSGSTQGVTSDNCSFPVAGENLASALILAGFSFAIYSESMPSIGYTGCFTENHYYVRKHNPVVNWQNQNLSPEVNMPFDRFPSAYEKLPTVAIVIPNIIDDMHDGATVTNQIIQGDHWLEQNLDAYATWAKTHNSLLILTWDEDDYSSINRIPTIFVGPMVKQGKYNIRIDHYNILRTVEDMYGVMPVGKSRNADYIKNIWME